MRNIGASKHKAFWHLPVWFCQYFETVLQCWVIGESDTSLNMFNRVSFWSFCLPRLSCVALKLLILLGRYNAVLFSDWGKHNRITLYNVGGFVCQEQEANYVDMLLLTRGCTFITHTPAAVKALDKSFIRQILQRDKGEENPVTSRYWTHLRENEEKYLAHAQLSASFYSSASLSVCLSFSFFLCLSPLTAVILCIQWTRITMKGQITSPLFQWMERGQRSLNMR